ncbi:MAG: diguanylate cyclase [Rhodoferax sp.]|nr:diguanylate cyclase [Rhodoferax sp.]
MTRPVTKAAPRFVWLLGEDSYQRLCLRFWLMTTSVYLVVLTLQLVSVHLGLISREGATTILIGALCGIASFFVAMRSGWSKRLADPAMTAQQMVFAFLMLGLAYVLTPKLRATLLIFTPLVLFFGAFTLSPLRCRQLGVVAVLMLGLAIGFTVILQIEASDPRVEALVFACCAVIFTMSADMAARLSAIREKLRIQKKELHIALERNQLLARQDPLTGLSNRRHAMEMLEYEDRRAVRETVPPCLCMIDLDYFKKVNDTYGHAAGDEVLQRFAQGAAAALRGPDMLARWGGEEFLLMMPTTTVEEALLVVERLRQVLATPFVWPNQPAVQVTFSAGLASLRSGESCLEAVARADAALYQSKQDGRNRTVLADQ